MQPLNQRHEYPLRILIFTETIRCDLAIQTTPSSTEPHQTFCIYVTFQGPADACGDKQQAETAVESSHMVPVEFAA